MKILYPLLFAIYPILFLWDRYPESATGVIWYFVVSIIFGLVVIGVVGLLVFLKEKNISDSTVNKIIIISSVSIILFMAFGHIFNQIYHPLLAIQLEYLTNVFHKELITFTELFLIFIYTIVLLMLFRIVTTSSNKKLKNIKIVFLFFGSTLVVIPALSLATKYYNSIGGNADLRAESFKGNSQHMLCSDCYPDVYYIILDGYGRDDILNEFYDFDNYDFIESLEGLGFFVSREARSNYSWTFLSLSSSLNMAYIDDMDVDFNVASRSRYPLNSYIRDSAVSRHFKRMGYKHMHMASTWGPTRYNDYADVQYNCEASAAGDDFYRVFLEGTILRLFSRQVGVELAHCHLNNFTWLGETAPLAQSPKFIFSHFIPPHHPYLFDEAGNIQRFATLSDQFEFQRMLWADREAYIQQLKFVNKKIIETVKNILANSESTPIIVIQSDHGVQLTDSSGERDDLNYNNGRSGIFFAIFTPDNRREIPVKSPVNIFRFLFSEYFDHDLDLLDDKVFMSEYERPFAFEEIGF
jgi:hypothetical protein